jgi:hypothetical protein
MALKTLEQGAGFGPSIEGRSGGKKNFDCNVDDEQVKDYAVDKGNAERLWKLSEELAGEKFDY